MKKNNQGTEKNCRILLGGRELQYILKKSGRKTVGIAIDSNGLVTVACPVGTPETYIHHLLNKKSGWILEKLSLMEENMKKSRRQQRNGSHGEIYYYRGDARVLRLIENRKKAAPEIKLDDGSMVMETADLEKEYIKKELRKWYIARFVETAGERISVYSPMLGVFPNRITAKEQKTRWGSCSSKGNINLNWKLIMAPPEVLDYVVVHELCHLKVMNHSKEFWQLVQSMIPQYAAHRNWLKQNGHSLHLD